MISISTIFPVSPKVLKSSYYHLRPYLVYAKFELLQENGKISKAMAWIVVTNKGPKVICQGLYQCIMCAQKEEEGKSKDGKLTCMMCNFKCCCHSEMKGHIDHENHVFYF